MYSARVCSGPSFMRLWGRHGLICLLAFLAIALFLINVYLGMNIPQDGGKFLDLPKFDLDYNSLPLDSSGQYKIQVNFLHPKIHNTALNQFDVTLVTHCTANHLHYLLDLVNHWKGPVSLAVFVPGHDVVIALKSLLGLHLCSDKFRDRVTVHLVFPRSHPPEGNDLKLQFEQILSLLEGNCYQFTSSLSGNDKADEKVLNYANVKVPYPNNLLRNVGRSTVPTTDYVFVVDVDLMCNGNLYHEFLELAQQLNLPSRTDDKRVFVVATFESTRKLPLSLSKQDLVKLWDDGTVQPFYFSMCWKCQSNLDYDMWRSFHSSASSVQIAYSVEWKDPWEPFYIGPNSVPHYDERFKQFGFNRISQVCETHFMGYNFVILDNAFVIHHGFKKFQKFHSSKKEENDRNREIFRTLKKELRLKFPQSKRHC